MNRARHLCSTLSDATVILRLIVLGYMQLINILPILNENHSLSYYLFPQAIMDATVNETIVLSEELLKVMKIKSD